MFKLLIMFLVLLSQAGYAAPPDYDRLQTEERIKPVGQVSIAGQADKKPEAVSPTPVEEVKKEPGQDTYEQYCVVCHKAGLAGAPKFRDQADWATRIKGKSIDDLLQIALKGLNAMPPKGTCASCTDDQLKAAIEYMLPKND